VRADSHFDKADRLEASMTRLDPDDNYETIIENCMLAGTHYLNGALHIAGVLPPIQHLLHSDEPPTTYWATVPEPLRPAFSAMKFIEDLRPRLVRGDEVYAVGLAGQCLSSYHAVKEICRDFRRTPVTS
jgi:hypothetical protein